MNKDYLFEVNHLRVFQQNRGDGLDGLMRVRDSSCKTSRVRLDIDRLQIPRGQLIAIVGPNGSGKSTLLHCLAGGLKNSGDIIFCGENISLLRQYHHRELAKYLSVLSQINSLEFNFKVQEVIAFGLANHACSHTGKKQFLNIAANFADVGHLFEKNYDQLSGGEQQRVQLARAYIQVLPNIVDAITFDSAIKPVNSDDTLIQLDLKPCLLLDEPTASLDLKHQNNMYETLKIECQRGLSAIIVSHDLNSVLRYADQVIVMQDGRCIDFGSPEEVFHADQIKQVYEQNSAIIDTEFGKRLVFF